MAPIDNIFDRVCPREDERMTVRRWFLRGAGAFMLASALPAHASSHSVLEQFLRYVERARKLYGAKNIYSTCLDPRHSGARSIAGGDVCLLTAGHALGAYLDAHSIHQGLVTNKMVFAAACKTVGGENFLHRHTDAEHLATGGNPKGADGCLFCRMLSESPRSFKLNDRRRDELFEGMLALPTNSHVYEGAADPFGFLTVRQVGYKPGDPVWGIDGTALVDGVKKQLYVDHQTLGEAHLANFAQHLLETAPRLASRMTSDQCKKGIAHIWKYQTDEIIRIKKERHDPNFPHASLTIMPDGTINKVRLTA